MAAGRVLAGERQGAGVDVRDAHQVGGGDPARRVGARDLHGDGVIRGSRLIATGDLLTPRGVTARQGCRGTVTMRVMAGNRPARSVSGRLNRNCEFLFGTRRPPVRLGRPSVTMRARLAPPSFRP